MAATHGLLVEAAEQRLSRSSIPELVVTDTIPQHDRPTLPLSVCSVAPLLADAIGRLHRDEPLDDLLGHA